MKEAIPPRDWCAFIGENLAKWNAQIDSADKTKGVYERLERLAELCDCTIIRKVE